MSAIRPLLVLVAVAAVLIGGCGGGDSDQADVPPSFFGVAPQDPPSAVDFARMAEGGVGSYHLLLAWTRVERMPGTYDWSSYDTILTELARNGIEPVPYVFGTPQYLAERAIVPPTTDPDALSAWEAFLTAAAERYGPQGAFWDELADRYPDVEPQPLRVWEIWNEVNSPSFWQPKPSPEDYATLLRRSAKAIKAVDPDAEIMTAGMFATPNASDAIVSFDFLRELFRERDIRDLVDVVGVHPYGPDLEDVREQVERTHAEVQRAGVETTKLWVTELGWGSDAEVGSELAVSPTEQARLLRDSYEMLIENRSRWNVQGALWYTWRDPVERVLECPWCPSAGLFDRDLDPKPAWEEFTALTGGS